MQFRGILRDSTGRLRTVWRLLIYGLALVGVYLLTAVVVGTALAIFIPVERLEEPAAILLITGVGIPFHFTGVFLVTWLCRQALDRRGLRSLGIRKPGKTAERSPAVGFLVGAGAALIPLLVLVAVGALRPGPGRQFLWPLILVLLFLVMAFVEELVFRGYVLSNFLDIGRPAAGIVISSTLFTVVHAPNPHFWQSPVNGLTIGMAGLLLALARLLSEGLWFPTALHLGWNVVQGPLFGLPVSGIPVPGILPLAPQEGVWGAAELEGFGLEGSPLAVMALALTTLLLLAWMRRRAAASDGKAGE